MKQKRDGVGLLPELYYVPDSSIEAEKKNPGSQTRLPNENVPLVWAQSLWWLGQMLEDGLLERSDLDPLGRHRRRETPPVAVQAAVLAEDPQTQAHLADLGIVVERVDELDTIELRPAQELARFYASQGAIPDIGTDRSAPASPKDSDDLAALQTTRSSIGICPFAARRSGLPRYGYGDSRPAPARRGRLSLTQLAGPGSSNLSCSLRPATHRVQERALDRFAPGMARRALWSGDNASRFSDAAAAVGNLDVLGEYRIAARGESSARRSACPEFATRSKR